MAKSQKGYILVEKNGKRRRLHHVVWEEHYGNIRDGYVIHHKDNGKENNDISNLHMMTKDEHDTLHRVETLIQNTMKTSTRMSYRKIGRICGVAEAVIRKIMSRKGFITKETAEKLINGIKSYE